jgi:hypothetical protein
MVEAVKWAAGEIRSSSAGNTTVGSGGKYQGQKTTYILVRSPALSSRGLVVFRHMVRLSVEKVRAPRGGL